MWFLKFQVSRDDFRKIALQLMDEPEAGVFVNEVFKMFDSNQDRK